jgi:hypothetical protein
LLPEVDFAEKPPNTAAPVAPTNEGYGVITIPLAASALALPVATHAL